MRETDIKKAFEGLNPTGEQKERIYQNLKQNTQSTGRKSGAARKALAAAASIVLVVFLAGVGANAATGGKVVEYIGGLFSPKEVKEDIVNQISVTGLKGFEVWAPSLFEVSDTRIVFGDRRGLIVYDRTKEEIVSTLDLQAIDSGYFGGDTKDTHVLVKDDRLIIYNTENDKPFGNYYIFDLNNANEGLLEEYEDGANSVVFEDYTKEWQKLRAEHFKDAFLVFDGSEPVENSDKGLGMYSKEAYVWEGGDSIIYVDSNNRFYLYTRESSATDTKVEIAMGDLVNAKPVTSFLPKASYLGTDPVEKAVYEEILRRAEEYYAPEDLDSICIPLLNPVGRVTDEEEILYYGNFFRESFVRNGNTLESVSGGSGPGVMHLVKQGDSYVVTELETAEDGGGFEESLKALCRGNDEIYNNFINGTGNDISREDAMTKALREYVNHNGLENEIIYYKEYGWDPVKINQ